MNLILKRDPIWPGLLPLHRDTNSLLLLGGDGQQVGVPAALLLAVSPLLRSILTDLLPSAYSPCCLSVPDTTADVLEAVKDILTTGTVACHHGDGVGEVKQVFDMLGVEALLVSCNSENIQVGQVLDMNIKNEFINLEADTSLEKEKIKIDVIVKSEDAENTDEVNKASKAFEESVESVHNKKALSCNMCHQKFTVRRNLVRHTKSTHNYKNSLIPCNLCPQKFTRKDVLMNHVKVVHEQVKIQCHLCPQKFSAKNNLMRHIKSVHEQVKFQCHLCSKQYNAKRNLVEHIESTHIQVNLQCHLCPQKFTNRKHLKRHVKTVHVRI